MANYFNTLPLRAQLAELGKCRFMHLDEFSDGVEALRGKKMVCLLYTSPSPRDGLLSRMPSSA